MIEFAKLAALIALLGTAIVYGTDVCRLPGERDHLRAGFAMGMGPPVCH